MVWRQVVALSEKHLPKGSLSQLPLQDDVVSLDVLDDFNAKKTNHSFFGVNSDACKMSVAFNGVNPMFLVKKHKVV